MSCIVELVPPRTLPRTSSGKLSRAKAKKLAAEAARAAETAAEDAPSADRTTTR
jgi:acyl-coenzyme A synthetase/AMP-(fatty) acid ligase